MPYGYGYNLSWEYKIKLKGRRRVILSRENAEQIRTLIRKMNEICSDIWITVDEVYETRWDCCTELA